MKKTILIILTALFILSCSKNDDGVDTIEVKGENMWGTWYFKDVILTDGSVVPYVHKCASERDYADFTTLNKIYTYTYNTGCSYYTDQDCLLVVYNENVISQCDPMYNGSATLTSTTLRIDYPNSIVIFGQQNDQNTIKGVIFTKN
jgi:hypothetical protein